jgi:hypothetical protein
MKLCALGQCRLLCFLELKKNYKKNSTIAYFLHLLEGSPNIIRIGSQASVVLLLQDALFFTAIVMKSIMSCKRK